MPKAKMNGSTDLLAKAMREVVREAIEEGTLPVKESVDGLKKNVERLEGDIGGLKEEVKRLDTDMQNGFAELRSPGD